MSVKKGSLSPRKASLCLLCSVFTAVVCLSLSAWCMSVLRLVRGLCGSGQWVGAAEKGANCLGCGARALRAESAYYFL